MVLAPESLSVQDSDVKHKRYTLFSELFQGEKLPDCPPKKKSGVGFLSNLLASEKLSLAPRDHAAKSSLRNLLTSEKLQ